MIYCKRAQLTNYRGLHPNLDKAIEFLQTARDEDLALGRNEICGDDAYLNRFDYDTLPEQAQLFESHAVFADVHLVLSGRERILCAQEAALQVAEADEASDYTGLTGEADASFCLSPGDVLIVFPGEAHKVKCMLGDAPCRVRKAVAKVRV